ncbi:MULTISPECIES: prohibitin family protein [unclassified Roseiflexus]|jgi:regulator of protease activity HflC (stomatin/prohibitin superfamily)|uniref:prohibitin family protein n=1 Tax=unclassified Roseiflexus TaxID=2609473 RepID=UPI0000D81049|nr:MULTISPECIES: prohibitin family protein [unclassified Roseiflexus]ABQ91292.1 SPFH domain, Band 7 family protein [Roseiflexus sp. RS-1]MCL6541048.1 prohibitin family protein [Roseiflexus sp.]
MNQGQEGRAFQNPDARGRSVSVLIVLSLIVVVAIFLGSSSVTTIEAGTRGVLKTFGEITGVLEEGLHFRMPFITSVTIVEVRTQRYESNSSAASRDLQTVTTQVVINYRPDAGQVDRLVREIGVDYERRVVDPAIQESIKAATARFTAEELITRRPEVSELIQRGLSERLTPRGVIVESVSITDFNFSPEFARAIEAKQVAEQDALRAARELERARIEAQQQVARAEAEAKARLEIARAEAEALRLQREVISAELLQLRFIERWDGVMPRFVGGENSLMPMLSIPSSEVLGASTPTPPRTPAEDQAPAPANEQPATSP